MRILIAGQTYYIKNNGQAVFTINLAEGLAQAGHSVLVLAPSERARPYRKQHNGLTIQTVPTMTLPFNVNVMAQAAAVAALQGLIEENYGHRTLNISPNSIYTGAVGAALFAQMNKTVEVPAKGAPAQTGANQ